MAYIKNPKILLPALGFLALLFFFVFTKNFIKVNGAEPLTPLSSSSTLFLPNIVSDTINAPGFVPPDYGIVAHEEKITLPACDENARILNDQTDLNQVNWQANDVFCFQAGDYTSWGEVYIEAVSGTAVQPKVLRYYDPNDATPSHPIDRAGSPDQEAVILQLHLEQANYWLIDGLTIRNSPEENRLTDASFVIFNRILIEGGDAGFIRIVRDSDNNVIQNSVLRNPSPTALKNDEVCILLYTQDWDYVGLEIENTRIINNEIYNCNDGIGLLRDSDNRPSAYPGTLIANNDIYITDALYTDCLGNPNPNGACACAENAIDIKATINEEDLDQSDKWVRLLNNRFWGFRHTDETRDEQGDRICASGSLGRALSSHFDARGLLIQGNIIMDSPIGISGGGAQDSNPPVTSHLLVNNLIYNIHDCYDPDKKGMKQFHFLQQGQFVGCEDENGEPTRDFGKGLSTTKNDDGPKHYGNIHFGNTLVDIGNLENESGWWAYIQDADHTFECNAILNSAGKDYYTSHESNVADKNAYYNSVPYCPMSYPCDGQTMIDRPSAEDSAHISFSFLIKKWSAPEQFTIPYALQTAVTPSFDSDSACWIDDPDHPWN